MRRYGQRTTSSFCAIILASVAALSPMTAIAETAYVTDNLRLGLHQAPDTGDRAFRYLDSGQAMEILSRDRNYANVRLPNNDEGWVKNAYLVDDKPAKLIVAEITAERDGLITELEETKQAFAAPAATIEALQADATAFASTLAEKDAQIADLQEANDDFFWFNYRIRIENKSSLYLNASSRLISFSSIPLSPPGSTEKTLNVPSRKWPAVRVFESLNSMMLPSGLR